MKEGVFSRNPLLQADSCMGPTGSSYRHSSLESRVAPTRSDLSIDRPAPLSLGYELKFEPPLLDDDSTRTWDFGLLLDLE